MPGCSLGFTGSYRVQGLQVLLGLGPKLVGCTGLQEDLPGLVDPSLTRFGVMSGCIFDHAKPRLGLQTTKLLGPH